MSLLLIGGCSFERCVPVAYNLIQCRSHMARWGYDKMTAGADLPIDFQGRPRQDRDKSSRRICSELSNRPALRSDFIILRSSGQVKRQNHTRTEANLRDSSAQCGTDKMCFPTLNLL